jgi:hypothetical protein
MQKITLSGILIVLAHVIAIPFHGLAHMKIPISISLFQGLFVSFMSVFVPIASIVLLWKQFYRVGVWLLLCSMVSSLAFDSYNHFIVFSPDRIDVVPHNEWGLLFQVTAVILAMTEAIGCGVGVWGLLNFKNNATEQCLKLEYRDK